MCQPAVEMVSGNSPLSVWGSHQAEMDDHKMYYDPPDLWPLLVRSGFRPKNIKLFKHKFGLDTFAICSKTATAFSIVDHSQVAD